MKNIDKVREMTPKELVKFMKSDRCSRCTYNGTNCHSDFCTEGMTQWLEQESELTIRDIKVQFKMYCNTMRTNGGLCSTKCYIFATNGGACCKNDECEIIYAMKNFNIIDGKITKR